MMENENVKWEFLLFISKKTPKLEHGIAVLEKICKKFLKESYSIEVIDILQNPETALEENIVATPTLLRKRPEPPKRIIGDISDEQKLFAHLEISDFQ